MKVKDLRTKEKSELKQELKRAREKLANLVYQNSLGKLKNTSEIRRTKADVARILTILKEKEILENG